MRADMMAHGRHLEVLRERWDETDIELLIGASAELHPLNKDEMEILEADMQLAKAGLETELRMKCDYWLRLPWVLCGLAYEDEEQSRALGARALAAFDQDPRQSAHHPKTWRLLHAGSAFRNGLEYFIQGKPRWECNDAFTMQVAAFKYIPVTETDIEEKHARVS
jgi:hypothetical protein